MKDQAWSLPPPDPGVDKMIEDVANLMCLRGAEAQGSQVL